MTIPRTYKTEAIVLKQMPLGEADRILTLYTPDFGKLRTVAKGVRRAKSRLGGHVELLSQGSVSLSHGRNLDVITESEVLRSYQGFKQDLGRLTKAIYMAEAVDVFSEEGGAPSYDIYHLLAGALESLEATPQPELLLRYFEMRLLDYSGYRPELTQCVDCRSQLEPVDHFFNAGIGGVLCPSCRVQSSDVMIPAPLNVMKLLRFMQRQEFDKVEAVKVSAEMLSGVERVMHSYIRYLIERELKSAEFMNLVTSSPAPAAFP